MRKIELAAGAWISLVLLAIPPWVPAATAAAPAGAPPPANDELLDLGRRLYARRCAACHGTSGAGDGEAAYLLYPKPRDLTAGRYRFVSTWDGVPTDGDLFRVISRGIPGSAMPSWAHLPERARWALVHYVKSLSAEPLVVPPPAAPDAAGGELGRGVVALVPEPPDDAASRARGRALFAQHCAQCHGESGRGDGPSAATLVDGAGFPIRPRDLRSGVFKGSPEPELLYRRILAGIPGTPMPQASLEDPVDGWHLVHYVLSLSSERLRQRAEMKRFRIVARRVERIPDHPDSGAWRQAPPVELHLMPLWWRYTRPEVVTVQALHDGRSLALLLTWADDTHDQAAIRPQDFRDAAAVQLAAPTDDPFGEPFFAMGEPGFPVNVWMWKADREAELKGFHDVDWQYPDIGIDSYPNLQLAPYEQPMRDALTVASDPTFITAWGAGNIVADPLRRSSAEDLTAQGFGTLRVRPGGPQEVEALGTYELGSYRVLFRRALTPAADDAVSLAPGARVSVAFAIWNGAAGDRDGKKSVSIWQDLVLAE
ncbi:MAG: hypothetical protein D6696_15705 [Acidobacteria bacterium]|nr:MAG: hypothetical protein D6696_15705 [Acidobacteriota bacterium]